MADTHDGCTFCKVIAGEIPAQIVHQDDEFVAFRDIDPQAPTHLLVVPRHHLPNAAAAAEHDEALLGRLVAAGTQRAAAAGIADTGFRMVINSGVEGGQTVDHVHLHVMGGRQLMWPPG